ncbi:Peptidase family M23 [Rhodobacteraceae bacterium THAF1]|uniref:M23 family metallopeptidase n=1 Tax=Palleronia sp. THAF1 TaxID=2587842 RepID=UPI000F3C3D34|nr:M23 family metallopeptidase [Palleronia sp. THAF1]QFU07792.1 Peptidase family M23 [Palleronia sp. THAF1]VDC25607.1 Peptidase family M23 [Rhodobacteraceae bacterium THAF1]
MRLALPLCLLATPLVAQDFTLSVPLDCPDDSCFIQQYVDRDPGPGATDLTCGPLSYDDHKGTDFALPSLAMMEGGVPVRAAAPGTITGVRDELPDIPADAPYAPDLDGRDCGNGVVVDHGGGWETQYCHMKQGSVAVAAGDTVSLTTVLGQVGLSGRTQFPHLHLSVRKDGAVVDPFEAVDDGACGYDPTATLFADPPAYQPGGLIASGFSDAVPEYADVKAGTAGAASLSTNDPALVIWSYAFGSRAGDALDMKITGPEDEVIAQSVDLERTQAQLFRAIGRRTPPEGWPAGSYTGEIALRRGDDVIDRQTIQITLD